MKQENPIGPHYMQRPARGGDGSSPTRSPGAGHHHKRMRSSDKNKKIDWLVGASTHTYSHRHTPEDSLRFTAIHSMHAQHATSSSFFINTKNPLKYNTPTTGHRAKQYPSSNPESNPNSIYKSRFKSQFKRIQPGRPPGAGAPAEASHDPTQSKRVV
jgi:hypothetical protein